MCDALSGSQIDQYFDLSMCQELRALNMTIPLSGLGTCIAWLVNVSMFSCTKFLLSSLLKHVPPNLQSLHVRFVVEHINHPVLYMTSPIARQVDACLVRCVREHSIPDVSVQVLYTAPCRIAYGRSTPFCPMFTEVAPQCVSFIVDT